MATPVTIHKHIDTDKSLQNKAILGITLMLLGLALFALSDAFLKHLTGMYSIPQTLFLRAVTRTPLLLLAIYFQGGIARVLSTRSTWLHMLRVIVNMASTAAFMYAISFGSLTFICTLGYTCPLFMIILSAFVLKEKVGQDRWIAVIVGLCGVVIATKPGTNVFSYISLIVLLGAFLNALNKILIRQLAKTEHSLAIALFPNLFMIFATIPFLFFAWKSIPIAHIAVFLFVGVITAVSQYCITQALRYAQGSALAPVDYSTFFWVVSLDFLWWDKIPEIPTVIGAAIVIGSNLFILRKMKMEQKKMLNEIPY